MRPKTLTRHWTHINNQPESARDLPGTLVARRGSDLPSPIVCSTPMMMAPLKEHLTLQNETLQSREGIHDIAIRAPTRSPPSCPATQKMASLRFFTNQEQTQQCPPLWSRGPKP